MSDLYTTDRAAEYLGVTPSRVRQLIAEERLDSVKIGRDHVIDVKNLKYYMRHEKRAPGRPRK